MVDETNKKPQKNKATLYVEARREGLGAREAARRAGYVHGVPSATARRLWEKVQALEAHPELRTLLHSKAEGHRIALAEAREWVRAIRLVLEGV